MVMGVIQKVLSEAHTDESRGGVVSFELNEPHPAAPNGTIHIQNRAWRIEMPTEEFLDFAVCCVEAGYRLKKAKKIES
jgi:hypothetical protein